MDVPYWQPQQLQQQTPLPPGQPMDLSMDEVDEQNIDPIDDRIGIPFTTEACLQRRIAYVITSIAISLLRRKEVFYPMENGGGYNYNCLPPNRFKFNANHQSGTHYGLDLGESLGRVIIPDESCTRWESRELFAGVNVQLNYYKICFVVQVLTKQLAKPSRLIAGRVEEIKHQFPVVAQIWNHFHVMIKSFAKNLYEAKEWKDTVSLIRQSFADIIDVQKMSLNFGNKAVSSNHQALCEYVMLLAEQENQFISCFERVCSQWEDFKRNWKNEEKEAEAQSHRLTKIGLL